MLTNNVRTCPFCGEIPVISRYRIYPSGFFWEVSCRDGKCHVEVVSSQPTKNKAIDYWNMRKGGGE
jgi:hypothetical protein